MSQVVLVHGIDQHQKSADALEAEWLPALAGGIRNAGFPDLADKIWRNANVGDIDCRMAFYGNLFLRKDQQGDTIDDFADEEIEIAQTLAREWLERATERSPTTTERQTATRELAFLQGEIGEEEMGIRNATRSAIASASRVRWLAQGGMAFAERFTNRALKQVTSYLTNDQIRKEAQERVLAHVADDTRVIISHSLGTVVAFECLHFIRKSIPLFITLGSPLGLETIIYPRLRPNPPTFPPSVSKWINVAAEDDIVATELDLTSPFSDGKPTNSTLENYLVENGSSPHNAAHYLGKPETVGCIPEALHG